MQALLGCKRKKTPGNVKECGGLSKGELQRRVQVISKASVFSGLSDEHLETIARLAVKRKAQAEEVLVKEGQKQSFMFFLIKGRIIRLHDSETSSLEAGSISGMRHFVNQSASYATLVCEQPSELLVIPSDPFNELLKNNQSLSYHMMRKFLADFESRHPQALEVDTQVTDSRGASSASSEDEVTTPVGRSAAILIPGASPDRSEKESIGFCTPPPGSLMDNCNKWFQNLEGPADSSEEKSSDSSSDTWGEVDGKDAEEDLTVDAWEDLEIVSTGLYLAEDGTLSPHPKLNPMPVLPCAHSCPKPFSYDFGGDACKQSTCEESRVPKKKKSIRNLETSLLKSVGGEAGFPGSELIRDPLRSPMIFESNKSSPDAPRLKRSVSMNESEPESALSAAIYSAGLGKKKGNKTQCQPLSYSLVTPSETCGRARRPSRGSKKKQSPAYTPSERATDASTMQMYHMMYEEKGKLGKGGMGTVYKVLNRTNGLHYAVKKFHGSTNSRDLLVMSFDHQNIARYYASFIGPYEEYDSNDDDDDDEDGSMSDAKTKTCPEGVFSADSVAEKGTNSIYLVTHYYQQGTLHDYINARREVDKVKSLSIVLQIINGLLYLHERGFIHRDLKPSNIFISDDNVVKIGDFGLATQEAPSSRHSRKVGTPSYTSPEQWGCHYYNATTDIWSLGIIMFELYQIFGTMMEREDNLTLLRTENQIAPDRLQPYAQEMSLVQCLVKHNPEHRMDLFTLRAALQNLWTDYSYTTDSPDCLSFSSTTSFSYGPSTPITPGVPTVALSQYGSHSTTTTVGPCGTRTPTPTSFAASSTPSNP